MSLFLNTDKLKYKRNRNYALSSRHYQNTPNLNNICIIKDHRKINNDHTLSYDNKLNLIDSPPKYSIANQKIEVRKTSKEEVTAHFTGLQHKISELN